MFAADAGVRPEEDGYTVSFTLPKGSFATSVLRELMKTDVDAPGEGPEDEEAGAEEVGAGA